MFPLRFSCVALLKYQIMMSIGDCRGDLTCANWHETSCRSGAATHKSNLSKRLKSSDTLASSMVPGSMKRENRK